MDGAAGRSNQLQPICVVGTAAKIIAHSYGSTFITVESNVDLPVTQHQRHAVPLTLLELGLHAQLGGQHVGQVHFKADEMLGIFGIGKDVRSASFLIRAPNERVAAMDFVECIGRSKSPSACRQTNGQKNRQEFAADERG